MFNKLLKKSDLPLAIRLTVDFAKSLPVILPVLFIVGFMTNDYLEDLGRDLYSTEQGPWIAQIGEFLASLIEGFTLLLCGGIFLVRRKNPGCSWSDFFRLYLSPITAESLRALTQVLLWSLALLIPGFVMYCRMAFVPFVVLVDPTYKDRPDAVARSLAITKDCWIQLTAFTMLLTIIDGVMELAPEMLPNNSWELRLPFDLAGFLFSLFGFVLMYIIFENLRNRHDSKRG